MKSEQVSAHCHQHSTACGQQHILEPVTVPCGHHICQGGCLRVWSVAMAECLGESGRGSDGDAPFLLHQWFRETRVIGAAAELEYSVLEIGFRTAACARTQFSRACWQGMISISENSACCKLEHFCFPIVESGCTRWN